MEKENEISAAKLCIQGKCEILYMSEPSIDFPDPTLLKCASHGVISEPAGFRWQREDALLQLQAQCGLANLDLSQNFRFVGYGGVRLTLELR